jgi:hypothetical protein
MITTIHTDSRRVNPRVGWHLVPGTLDNPHGGGVAIAEKGNEEQGDQQQVQEYGEGPRQSYTQE